jgi:hypothetical protein
VRKLLVAVVVVAVLVAAGLVVAALIRQTGPAAPTRRYPRAPREPDSTPTRADSEPRFACSVGGGFDGEGGGSLTITSAGKVILIPPSAPLPDSWNISSSQVAKLTDLFNRLDFMHMRTTPELSPHCPDGFTSYLTYRYRGLTNTVEGGNGGTPEHPFWQCNGALWAVVGERRRALGEETLAASPARIDFITVDGKPVAAGGEVSVDSRRPHRISWRGVGKEGCAVTGFSIAIWRGWRTGSLFDYAYQCPDGNYDYTFPDSGYPYCVTPVVHFSDNAWSWAEFNVVPTGARPGPQDPGRVVTPVPQRRSHQMTLSKRNRVGRITVDGKPVAPGDTVGVEGGRSHRISWQGICADGCKPMRLSIAVRAGYNGGFIDLANSCPGGYYDYKFPVSKRLFWLTPRVDFTDYTYAWEGFFVTSRERP